MAMGTRSLYYKLLNFALGVHTITLRLGAIIRGRREENMAKSHSTTRRGRRNSKSNAIREALAQNPNADTKQIVTILDQQGIKVAPTLVYYVKSKLKMARRQAKRVQAHAAARNSGSNDPVGVVLRVRDLARDVGGYRNLKQMVDALAE